MLASRNECLNPHSVRHPAEKEIYDFVVDIAAQISAPFAVWFYPFIK